MAENQTEIPKAKATAEKKSKPKRHPAQDELDRVSKMVLDGEWLKLKTWAHTHREKR